MIKYILFIPLFFLSLSDAFSYPIPTISASDVRTFQAWTVLKINENGQKYINLCSRLGNTQSIFRIHLSKSTIGYTIALYKPAAYYPESVTVGQATISINGNYHRTQVYNIFQGTDVISYLNLSNDFIKQLKNSKSFIVQFPIGPPLKVSLSGFNQALKYANNILKKL